MLLIPALLGLIAQVAPSIVGLLAGSQAQDVAQKVVSAAQVVTGTDSQEAAQAALQADPAKLQALQVQLAQIALEAAKAADEDRQNARAREVSTHDRTPSLLAAGVTTGFFGLLGVMVFRGVPPADAQVLNILLGSLGTGWTMILSYYFGASAQQGPIAALGGGASRPLGK